VSVASAASLNSDILAMPPSADQATGVQNFVDVIGNFMDQLQAGPTGAPGIFTFGRPAMFSILMTQAPVASSAWIATFANAWEAGVLTAVVTPGTVLNPAWIGSGGVDAVTLPSGAATILTVAVAKAGLIADLASVAPSASSAMPFATAIRNATLALTFNCIGLSALMVPVPIPTPAQ
jgi:hypothetical protein